MQCKNHAGIGAVDRCTGCAEPFCGNCLVEIHGRKYCGSCKVLAVGGQPVAPESMIPCPEASDSLKYAIIGIFWLPEKVVNSAPAPWMLGIWPMVFSMKSS